MIVDISFWLTKHQIHSILKVPDLQILKASPIFHPN